MTLRSNHLRCGVHRHLICIIALRTSAGIFGLHPALVPLRPCMPVHILNRLFGRIKRVVFLALMPLVAFTLAKAVSEYVSKSIAQSPYRKASPCVDMKCPTVTSVRGPAAAPNCHVLDGHGRRDVPSGRDFPASRTLPPNPGMATGPEPGKVSHALAQGKCSASVPLAENAIRIRGLPCLPQSGPGREQGSETHPTRL